MASDVRPEKGAPLTEREREVLRLILDGLQAKEIARALGISPRTVEWHRQRILAKKGVPSTAVLFAQALAERAA